MTPSAGTRWTTTLAAALLAGALALSASAAKPATADAWAWKDSCLLTAYNATPKQSLVRPVLYTPLPPLPPASLALYAALAVNGIPNDGNAVTFINTGYPVPTYGCHAMMQFLNPGDNENCTYNAPTTGANHFNCSGAAAVKVLIDSDDIQGEVRFSGFGAEPNAPQPNADPDGDGDGGGSAFPSGLNPLVQKPALRPGELPGDQWVASQRIGDLGRAGDLMNAGDVSDACAARENGAVPALVQSSLLTRDGGDDGVGAVAERHDSAQAAQAQVDEVLSDGSIACLEGLLSSGDRRADVQTGEIPTDELAGGAEGVRLTLTRGKSTDVLDVIARTDGQEAHIVLLAAEDGPLPARIASAALRNID